MYPSVQVLAQAEMARVEAEEFQRVLEENRRIEEAKLQQVGVQRSAVCRVELGAWHQCCCGRCGAADTDLWHQTELVCGPGVVAL